MTTLHPAQAPPLAQAGPTRAQVAATPQMRTLSWTLFVVAAALAFASAALNTLWGLQVRAVGAPLPSHVIVGYTSPVTAIAYAAAGLLISARRPRNPVGWLFGGLGVLFGLVALLPVYVAEPSPFGGQPPLHTPAVWLDQWLWLPAIAIPFTILLLYFNGRLPSPRWRPVAWGAGLGILLLIVGTALHPTPDVGPGGPANPYGLAGSEALMDGIISAGYLLFGAAFIAATASLFVRYRSARGLERMELRWMLWGLALAVISVFAVTGWGAVIEDETLAFAVQVAGSWIGITVLGIFACIGIVRFRRYDIDLLVNRTLVYGTLSAAIVGLYMLLVASFGAIVHSTGSIWLALLAAAAGAVLLGPLRTRLQRAVNRWMYGAREDPYTVLSNLSQQMKSALVPNALLARIADAIAQALNLPYVALVLTHSDGTETTAAHGQPTEPLVAWPLTYQSETVGRLLVAPRPPADAFDPAEERLLQDIALQAGAAAYVVRLNADLQHSRTRLVTAREEERRRLRRDLHDGLGPQLASLSLTAAAARTLLRSSPDEADALLQELMQIAQGAVADIRRVVYQLRPPALDDLGLLSAIREQAARASRFNLEIVVDAPEVLPPLPAAVELAAYRVVNEALTNVVRHAQASHCTVALAQNGALTVAVTDDGVGFHTDGRSGVGLRSMRERTGELGGWLDVDSAPGRGTSIRAAFPLPQAAP